MCHFPFLAMFLATAAVASDNGTTTARPECPTGTRYCKATTQCIEPAAACDGVCDWGRWHCPTRDSCVDSDSEEACDGECGRRRWYCPARDACIGEYEACDGQCERSTKWYCGVTDSCKDFGSGHCAGRCQYDLLNWYCNATEECLHKHGPTCDGRCVSDGFFTVPCSSEDDADAVACTDDKSVCKLRSCPNDFDLSRQFCENLPEYDVEDVECEVYEQRCTGRRKHAQCVNKKDWCDGQFYHCMDLSDETDCEDGGGPKGQQSGEVLDHPICRGGRDLDLDQLWSNVTRCVTEERGKIRFGGQVGELCLLGGDDAGCGVEWRTAVVDVCPGLAPLLDTDRFCRDGTLWSGVSCDVFAVPSRLFRGVPCTGNSPMQCSVEFSLQEECHCHDNCATGAYSRCDDMSHLVCAANTTLCSGGNRTEMWFCRDGETCVHHSLVCDGYRQCPDGSDEAPDLCGRCPKEFGFVGSGSSPADATFPCRHKYTDEAICAVPCNGKDDFCRDMEDESHCSGQAPATVVTFVILVGAIATILAGEFVYHKRYLNEALDNMLAEEEEKKASNLISKIIQKLVSTVDVSSSKRKKRLGRQLHKLLTDFHKAHRPDLMPVLEAFRYHRNRRAAYGALYRAELSYYRGDLLARHIFLKQRVATLSLVKTFVDEVEPSVFDDLSKKLKSRLPSCCPRSIKLRFLERSRLLLYFYCKTLIYYFDFVKDALVVYLLIELSGSPLITGVLLGSMLLAEFSNLGYFLSQWHHVELSGLVKVAWCVFTPLMPAAVLWQVLKYDFYALCAKWHWTLEDSCPDVHKALVMHRLSRRRHYWQAFLSCLKKNENTVENLPQTLVLLTLLLQYLSSTSTVDGLQTIFTGSTTFITAASAALSALTIVRGAVAYHSALKNDALSVTGKVLLALFYLISFLARLFSVIVFATPWLGFFDTLQHFKHGRLKAAGNLQRVFDVDFSGYWPREIYFDEVWRPVTEYTHFTVLNSSQYGLVFLGSLISHVAFVLAIKWVSGDLRHMWRDKVRAVYHLMDAILFPTSFQDWDEEYRNSNRSDFDRLWRRQRTEMLLMICLFSLEHVFLCFPVWILLARVTERNAYVEEYFGLSASLRSATGRIWLLSTVPPGVFALAVPALQWLLLMSYYRRGHPWSKIFILESEKKEDFRHGRSPKEKVKTFGTGDESIELLKK